jgi:hypothetical protein
MTPRQIPTSLQRSIKSHRRILRKVSQRGGNRLLNFAPKTFFPLVKRIFQSILNGSIPVPFNLNRTLLDKVARAKNSEKVILQNGSGISTILTHVIPALASFVIPKIIGLFKKKKKT